MQRRPRPATAVRLSTASRLASPRSSTSSVRRGAARGGAAAASAESPAGPGGGVAAGLRGPVAPAPSSRGRLAARARARSGSGLASRDLLGQAVGEAAHQLRAHVLHHAAPELGGRAGDPHVGLDVHARAALDLLHRGRDRGGGRALPAAVARLRAHHRPAGLLVGLLDLDRALVAGGDRADLDRHRARVLVAVGALDRRARQARRDAVEVEQHRPRARRSARGP